MLTLLDDLIGIIHALLCRCFCCRVVEGYGMTETSCLISAMDEGDNLVGHVGSPNPACGKFHFFYSQLILLYFHGD